MPDKTQDPLEALQTAVQVEFMKLQPESEQHSAYDLAEGLHTRITFSRTREQIREAAADLLQLCAVADKKFPVLASLVTAVRDGLGPVILIAVPAEKETPTDTVIDLGSEFVDQLAAWPESLQGKESRLVSDFAVSLFDAAFFARDYIQWIERYNRIDELLTQFRHQVQPDKEHQRWLHVLRRLLMRLNALLHKEAGAK